MKPPATAADGTTSSATWHALLRERYGVSWTASAKTGADTPAGDVMKTLLLHRSVRAYSGRALPDDILEIVMAAAQSAATSSNLQAWSVVAVRDEARKARLAGFAGNQKQVAAAPLLLVFIADLSRLRRVSTACDMPGAGLDYLETFMVALADAAFAAQNALVALESLGMGCCYIGAMRNHPEAVAAELALPPEAFAVFGMTVGYPAEDVETDIKPRLAAQHVLHLEQYRAETREDLAAYDDTMKAFQRRQNLTENDWTGQASRRVRGPEGLSGRDRIASALKALGFGLK